FSFSESRYEVWEEGRLLHSATLGALANATISSDGRRLAVEDASGVEIRDAVTGQTLWHIDCQRCFRIRPSGDGGRLLTWSPDGRLDLWDLERRSSIWSRRMAVGARDLIDLSEDGRRILWSRGAELRVSSVDGGEAVLRLDAAAQAARFSYDGSRFAVITQGSMGVW